MISAHKNTFLVLSALHHIIKYTETQTAICRLQLSHIQLYLLYIQSCYREEAYISRVSGFIISFRPIVPDVHTGFKLAALCNSQSTVNVCVIKFLSHHSVLPMDINMLMCFYLFLRDPDSKAITFTHYIYIFITR